MQNKPSTASKEQWHIVSFLPLLPPYQEEAGSADPVRAAGYQSLVRSTSWATLQVLLGAATPQQGHQRMHLLMSRLRLQQTSLAMAVGLRRLYQLQLLPQLPGCMPVVCWPAACW
jgi:hypothetical protein